MTAVPRRTIFWKGLSRNTPRQPRTPIVGQSAEDVRNTENAPALSMEPHLLKPMQRSLSTTISIYNRGEKAASILTKDHKVSFTFLP